MNNITFFKPKIVLQGCIFALCLAAVTQEAQATEVTANKSSYFQTTVKGKVISGTDKMPVPGVTVMIKGTTNAVTTDFDGNYEIAITDPNTVLVFSSIGFVAQEIAVGGQTNISITLAEDVKTLEEVVVVGYGVKKKATVTGSISEINGKEVAKSPAVNISNGFAGRVSGVIANNRGGEPGYDDSSITIRGLGTMGNNDVLVVVDGVPGQIGGLSRLSAQEIESITVLKDASAAIYGSRAANGVILVTTKKGKKSTKTQVSYNFDQGFSSPTRLPDMADAPTYAQIRNEIAYYNAPDQGMNQIYTQQDIDMFRDGSNPVTHPNTDWAKAALKTTSLQSQHNLNVQGGSESTNYFFSLGKLSQDGLYRNGIANYDQFNVRTNIDTQINERLKVGVSLSGRKEDRQFPIQSAGNIFRAIYRAYPTVVGIYPNGLPSRGIEGSNPLIDATRTAGINENPTYVFNGILRGSYDFGFLKGLSVDGFFSADVTESRSKSFATPFTLYTYNEGTDTYDPSLYGGGPNQKPSLYQSQTSTSQNVSNIKVNFKRQFGDHNIDAFVGYEQSDYKTSNFNATRFNFPTASLPELSQGGAATADARNGGGSWNYTRQSYLSRVAYNFQEKFLLDLQARVDGSSNFPKGSRFGFFPSVSAGYRISKEDWFKADEGFFNDLKIRASWGQLGNDNVPNFQYYDNYRFNNRYVVGDQVVSGIDLRKLGNPNITWEVATKTDIGLNATFLKNFTFEAIYFMQDRSDILWARNGSIPGSTGIVNPYNDDPPNYIPLVPQENIGKMKSNGIEATLGYRKNGDFSYGISGNFTYAKNEVKYIDEAPGLLDYQKQTGAQYNTYLLYNTDGIFRTQEQLDATPHVEGAQLGDLVYKDINGDGEITPDDMTRSKYSNLPRITYGLVMDAAYKNFDLSVVFAGQAQVSQYLLTESGTTGNFYSTWADNRWSPSNPNGSFPRVDESSGSSISGGLYRNDFWLHNTSFVRLKNVQLGYTLPTDITQKYGVSSFRLYLSAFNLFTLTKVKDFDPEGSSENGQFYPQQKIVNFGFNVQF
ncbi:SusC/RagA family TonB-linked outer membrane protein [Flavobacterium subsaxonicum]|uniref:TonB-dependent receptor n=1 Tax=Flavobacterium subsaxonicum WB 4.1-42 = DSM 21790 TaxID=1121898 RepID=A0A0A2MJH4_9FLAO|nr:TonB-dependent receptor [Flavobacterium subsaxonicum]KGO91711.1 TonB-dependent receptor [Flavobacterium subsaxonicum WB 4.1-42 = DSM 21790]